MQRLDLVDLGALSVSWLAVDKIYCNSKKSYFLAHSSNVWDLLKVCVFHCQSVETFSDVFRRTFAQQVILITKQPSSSSITLKEIHTTTAIK